MLNWLVRHLYSNTALILLSLVFLSHLPFLNADPDIFVSTSRGAFTDEGYYSLPIRNFIDHNTWTSDKILDGFIITPLFNIICFIPFKIFGTKLYVARFTVLFLCLFPLFLISKRSTYFNTLILLLTPIVLMQYYLYHFYHYALAEMLSITSIFLSFFFIHKAIIEGKNSSNFYAALFITISYILKIQYVYIIAVFPLFSLLWLFVESIRKKTFEYGKIKLVFKHLFFLLILFICVYLVHYLPNKNLFNQLSIFISSDQNYIEFKILNFKGIFLEMIQIINLRVIQIKDLKVFYLSYAISFIVGIIFLFIKEGSKNFRAIFLLATSWLIIESHKFTMIYLPTRYLLGFYFSMGLTIVVVIKEGYNLYRLSSRKKWTFLIPASTAIFILISNSYLYSFALGKRTYDIDEVNNYLAGYDYKNRPVIGVWAPSLTWETNTIPIPLKKKLLLHESILESYNPKVIVTEIDQEESDQVFKKEETLINQRTDSVLYKRVGRWDLKIIWLK